MKTIILLLTFLFSFAAHAQTASKIPSSTVAGKTITNEANLKVYWAANTTANRWTGLIKQGEQTNLAVPGGKKLTIFAIKITRTTSSGVVYISAGSDTATVAVNTSTALTSPIWAMGRDGSVADQINNLISVDAFNPADIEEATILVNFEVVAGRFPFLKFRTANTSVIVYGVEEDL